MQSFPDPNAQSETNNSLILFGRDRKKDSTSKIKKAAHNKTAEAVKGNFYCILLYVVCKLKSVVVVFIV